MYYQQMFILCFVVTGIKSIPVRIYPSENGIIGPSNLHLICTYNPEDGDTVKKVNIQTNINNSLTTLITFNINSSDATFTNAGLYLSSRVNLTNPSDESPNSVSMTFTLIECEDEVQYRCEVIIYSNDTFQSSTSTPTMIVVTGRPAVPDNGPTLIPSTGIEEGTKVTFTCTGNVGKPPGKFKWTRYRGSVQTEYPDVFTTSELMPDTCTYNGTSSLTIQMMAEDNNAIVRCVVVQELATSEMFRQTELVIHYRIKNIKITKSPNLSHFKENLSNIKMVCSADGYPPPTYTWYKDTDVNETLAYGNTFRLNKSDVIVNSTGNYVCMAKNNFNGKNFELTKTEHIQIDIATLLTTAKPTIETNGSTHSIQTSKQQDYSMNEKWSLVVGIVILSTVQVIEFVTLFVLYKKGLIILHFRRQTIYENTSIQDSGSHFYTTIKIPSKGIKSKVQGHYDCVNDKSHPNDDGHYEISLNDDSIEGHYELSSTDSGILKD